MRLPVRLLCLSCLIPLGFIACDSPTTPIGSAVVSDTGVRYAWATGRLASDRSLVAIAGSGGDVEIVDTGAFDQVLGPVAAAGGVAWARSVNGEWTIHRIGGSDSVARRSQGVANALAAAWALERVAMGLPPGDAAELAGIDDFARSDRWPR